MTYFTALSFVGALTVITVLAIRAHNKLFGDEQ